MKTFWAWTVGKFWWLWSANALAAVLVVFAFILGWKHESITAPNIPGWCGILAFVAVAANRGLGGFRRGQENISALLIAAAEDN